MTVARKKTAAELRSARWFAPDDLRAFGHRSRAMQMGYAPEDWVGRPVIAILNTWSDAQPCHMHFKSRVDDVKRGILQAGGFPMELPALSLSESFLKPTTMLYRNLLAMDAEELLRGHPVDGVVLMGGCDKTTPGPAAGRDQRRPAGDLPAGRADAARQLEGQGAGLGLRRLEILGRAPRRQDLRRRLGRCRGRHRAQLRHLHDHGHGRHHDGDGRDARHDAARRLVDPGGRRQPHPHGRRDRPAHRRHGVGGPDARRKILTRDAFLNAITVAMAVGCSTNAIIHLIALARRAGQDIGLDDFERASRKVPVIANIRPSGDKYLMEDFFYAGGLPALMAQIREHLHLDALTVTGKTPGREHRGRRDLQRRRDPPGRRTRSTPRARSRCCAATSRPTAASSSRRPARRKFLKHTGPALVFDDYPSMKAAIDRDDLDVTEDHVLILRNAGPQGGPGMPEWGMLPIPKKLVKQGVRDMVRLSDARMSGTSYGACILHVSPESYIGGPLALVRTGDMISLDVDKRTIDMNVSDEELARRRAAWKKPEPRYERGYGWMFTRHIKQANEGCDFDFLETAFGAPVGEPSIY